MLDAECTYHIYNRSNGSENLFREERNYDLFLEKYDRHIFPVAETFAYCLMPNHFHLMVRIRKIEDLTGFQNLSGLLSQQFSNFFNAYTKTINKTYERHGSLFQRPFKSKEVTSDAYFTQLILYIHNNPVKHGFAKDLRQWPYSSFHYLNRAEVGAGKESAATARVLGNTKKEVLDWFGGREWFEKAHSGIGEIKSVFE